MPREPSHGFSSIGEIFLLTFPFIEAFKTSVSLHFVPIPGAPEFAHGMNCG